ncbi:hypothetical protein QFC21_005598 [Naganishia friedmannii]|uniref:Uncharacterized protein n=1 Tax=Naganishia friedmannii TaxID=89922 RepID=A0ACC2V8E0_9TREE|nr:hypothetical protein QFC21_005598 [Naganishia friedmannii]
MDKYDKRVRTLREQVEASTKRVNELEKRKERTDNEMLALRAKVEALELCNRQLKNDVENVVRERLEMGLALNGSPILPSELLVLIAETLASGGAVMEHLDNSAMSIATGTSVNQQIFAGRPPSLNYKLVLANSSAVGKSKLQNQHASAEGRTEKLDEQRCRSLDRFQPDRKLDMISQIKASRPFRRVTDDPEDTTGTLISDFDPCIE